MNYLDRSSPWVSAVWQDVPSPLSAVVSAFGPSSAPSRAARNAASSAAAAGPAAKVSNKFASWIYFKSFLEQLNRRTGVYIQLPLCRTGIWGFLFETELVYRSTEGTVCWDWFTMKKPVRSLSVPKFFTTVFRFTKLKLISETKLFSLFKKRSCL